jgi:hypothetical protein
MTPEDKTPTDKISEGKDPDGRHGLRKAIIIFAVVEALVIAAVVFYTSTR